jgi:hypothetical protein
LRLQSMIRRLLVAGVAVLAAASCTGSGADNRVAGGDATATPERAQSSPPVEPERCRPDRVQLRTGGVSRPPPGRLVVMGFKRENHGRTPCNGSGYPSIVVQDAGHAAIRLHPEHGGLVEFGDPKAAKRVILGPGYEANFTIQMRPSGPNCLQANRAKVWRTTKWSSLTVDHRTVSVRPSNMREAAVYPPAFLASLD